MRAFAASATLATVFAMAACSGGTPAMEAPAPWSPVGTYQFSTAIQGMTVGGTMRITGTADMLAGVIEPEAAAGVPPLPMETIEVTGNEVTITADAGGETIFMVLLFAEDDSFEGSWTMAGDGGDVIGTKVGG